MNYKNIILIIFILIFYQTPMHSKSSSFDNFDSKNFSKYFSGIVAFENKDNSKALNFFDSSKILTSKHEPYLKKYVYSLILDNRFNRAVSIIKNNKNKDNTNFFDAYLILTLNYLKKNNLDMATQNLNSIPENILDRLKDAKDPLQEGINIAAEQAHDYINIANGIHLMAVKTEHLIPKILEKAELNLEY